MKIQIFKIQGLQACFKEAFKDYTTWFKEIFKKTWMTSLIFALLMSATIYLRLPNISLHNWGEENPLTAFTIQSIVYAMTLAAVFIPLFPFFSIIGQKIGSIKKALIIAFNHIGEVVISILLLFLITSIIMFVISIPSVILIMSQIVSQMGAIDGDPTGTPGYFTILLITFLTLTNFVFAYCITYGALVLAKLIGNYHEKERVKRLMQMNINSLALEDSKEKQDTALLQK